jgi:hypothetical protein
MLALTELMRQNTSAGCAEDEIRTVQMLAQRRVVPLQLSTPHSLTCGGPTLEQPGRVTQILSTAQYQ